MGKTYVKMRRHEETGTIKPAQVSEYINVLADMACGAQMNLTISAATGLAPADGAYLYGSQGTLHFTGGKLYGGRRGENSLQEIAIPAHEAGSWRVEEEFVNAIRGQEVITHTSFADGVKYMLFTEAVARGMAGGQTVSLSF
jgi:hypothetical protein